MFISGITADYLPKDEFVHSEFFERFDKKVCYIISFIYCYFEFFILKYFSYFVQISVSEAKKFEFPKQEGFVSNKYSKCARIRYDV